MVITLHLGRQLNSSNISKVTWQKDNWFSSSFSESIRNSDWDWRSWLQTCLLLSEQVLSLALVKTPLILTMDGQPKHQLTSCHISSSASSGHQRFAKDRQGFGPASGCFQVWFRAFSSASTVRHQVFLGPPLFLSPSGVQKRAIRAMSSCSLRIYCEDLHTLFNIIYIIVYNNFTLLM